MQRFKSYYRLSHKREGTKDYKRNTKAFDYLKILIHKIRLERRLKI